MELVTEYLRTTTNQDNILPSYTLQNDIPSTYKPPHVGRETALSEIRRKRQHQQLSQTINTTTNGPVSPKNQEDMEWAKTLLQNHTTDFAKCRSVWQLPSTTLSQLLQANMLDLDQLTGPLLSEFMKSVVADIEIGLENQCLLLQHIAQARWFNGTQEEAIPAVLQIQISALIQHHPQTVTTGLIMPLLKSSDQLSTPTTAMLCKVIKAKDMPADAVNAICNDLAISSTISTNDQVFQVMEALLSKVITGSSLPWTKGWIDLWQTSAIENKKSKKLSSLILHFVNKLGSHLDVVVLGRLSAIANILETPLKKPILAAISRKTKKNN